MTAKSPKRMIRASEPSIRGTRPPPRQVPGGGIPPGASPPPRLVEGGGLLPPVPLPPLPSRPAPAGQVAVGALPTAAAATPLGRMKNAELRGKIAKLERDNAALVTRLADLRAALVEIADELDAKMAARQHDQPLLDTAFRLRRVIP